jgi:hypothetical protein
VKHLNISRATSDTRQMSAEKWDKAVATQRDTIASAEYRLSLDWCTGVYADTARAEIKKALKKLDALMSNNPYENE